jgi:cysteine desulfurase family protein (TIGR01976 family)
MRPVTAEASGARRSSGKVAETGVEHCAYDPRVTIDIGRIRAAYPALQDGNAYLDGAAGTQVPSSVIAAISGAYTSGISNLGGAFAASRRSGEIVDECRRAVADLVGGVDGGVILGPNMTTLTYRIAATLAQDWQRGDEIVVSRLDHDANVRPWVQAAATSGVSVRWAEVEPVSGSLPAEQYDDLLSERTRLVAVTAASNAIGTRPDVRLITDKAHGVGALTYVDGVHWTPHGPVDVAELGADFYVTSAYKWSGPHIGAVIADPALLEQMQPLKLHPSADRVPSRFEWGTPPFADFAGVVAAVDHLAGLDGTAAGTRRERLVRSMTGVEAYEAELFGAMLARLDGMPHVTSYGRAPRRAPTAYFNVVGRDPADVAEHLAGRGVNVWSGDNYAWELIGALGLRQRGGAVRVGIVHYNDERDVSRLLEAVAELSG